MTMKKYFFSVLLLLTASFAYACEGTDQEWLSTHSNGNGVIIEGPFSVEQVEQRQAYTSAGETEPKAFGSGNNRWLVFKNKIKQEDKFYYVKHVIGDSFLEKYIVVRNKCVIDKYIISSKGIVEN